MLRAYLARRLFRAFVPMLLASVILLSVLGFGRRSNAPGGWAGAVPRIVHQTQLSLQPLISQAARALVHPDQQR